MRWLIVMILAMVMISGCTNQTYTVNNNIKGTVSTPLENKIVGTWKWSYDDTILYFTFYDNKTLIERFEYSNGTFASGKNLSYEIVNQSSIKITSIPSEGSAYMNYRFLNDDTLELKALGVSGWNFTRQNAAPASNPVCSDGTSYDSCSASKPKYCQSGALEDKCSYCGCSSEETCQSNDTCSKISNPMLIANGIQPKIYGDRIVFIGQGYFNRTLNAYISDIYSYDISTKEMTRITDNTKEYIDPHIYDNKVVYGHYQMVPNGEMSVYMYDLNTGKETDIVNNNQWQTNIYIYGDIIAWVDYRQQFDNIYTYSTSENRETKITNDTNSTMKSDVSVYGNNIVWSQWSFFPGTDNKAIYLYDLSSGRETQLTDSSIDCTNPRIYGNNVAYICSGTLYDYNLLTGSSIEIASDLGPAWSSTLSIYDDKIVWEKCVQYTPQSGNSICKSHDIFMYDLSTDKTTQITNDEADQRQPNIYGNKIVWWESNPSDVNSPNYVYLYELT